MSFANFPLAGVLAGIAALAGVLYLLQRLRVRHKPITVVTTMFWREAVEETRARVMVHRFRHLWAYLFVLAIASLLWIAIAEPRLGGEPERDVVVLFDGSAAMATGDRLTVSRDALAQFVESHPEVAQVIVCGAEPTTVLRRGEDPLLMERRLATITADPCPPTYSRVVREYMRSGHDRPIDFVLFSDLAVDPAFAKILPEDVTLTRRSAVGGTTPKNGGITAIGADAAASGSWNRADVFVEIRHTVAGRPRPSIEVTLDGAAYAVPGTFSSESGHSRFLFRDVPARGGTFTVTLTESDDNAMDDRASVVLPYRPLLRVALTPSLQSILRPVLESDPGVVIAVGNADVSIHRAGEAGVANVPALVLVGDDAQTDAFFVSHTDGVEDEVALTRAFAELGLEHIDTQTLAEESARPIRLGVREGALRQVSIWESLLSPEFDFVASRSFPIFVARAVRFLGGVSPIIPFAVPGEPLADTSARRFAEGAVTQDQAMLDPIGARFVPSRAGLYHDDRARTLSVALSDLSTVAPRSTAAESAATTGSASWPAWSWLALVALGLIMIEWFAYRTGRMP